MDKMFHKVNLTIPNYNEILINWSNLPLHYLVTFDGGYSRYNTSANNARNFIITTFNWTITDGGLVNSSQSSSSTPPYSVTSSTSLTNSFNITMIGLTLLAFLVSISFILGFISYHRDTFKLNSKSKIDFLKNKIVFKSKTNKNKISDKTLEMIETIIDENENK